MYIQNTVTPVVLGMALNKHGLVPVDRMDPAVAQRLNVRLSERSPKTAHDRHATRGVQPFFRAVDRFLSGI